MEGKILIVDDSFFNIKILADILIKEGLGTLFTANNGAKALKIIKEVKPDVILLDIVMPGMDGFEVCKILQSDYEFKDIPIIMVSANTNALDIKKALELGAFDYIKKPFEEIEIIARINSALKFKKIKDELIRLSTRDSLTGLYNRTTFDDLFDKKIAESKRYNLYACFVMIDIDKFKNINDTYGHSAGDFIIKNFVKILEKSVRKEDIKCRYGGDEFSLLLLVKNEKDGVIICERIKDNIAAFDFAIENKKIKITASIGLFTAKVNSDFSKEKFIENADKKLYISKLNGRNNVTS